MESAAPLALEKITALLDYYAENDEAFRTGALNEAQTREQLINPLFEALGWEIAN